MPKILSTRLPATDASPTTRINAVQKLTAMLRDKYGMSEQDVSSLDELGLIRQVATLDFLANNLPDRNG